MSDTDFRFMSALFKTIDVIFGGLVDKRVRTFGIREGMTVVDYGCGSGRYTAALSRLVGPSVRIYAVDAQELAITAVRKKIAKLVLRNVEPVLARGYDSGLPAGIANAICALDMFFAVRDPTAFLTELRRIADQGLC